MLINLLLLMLIVAQVVIGLRLLVTGRKNHLPNLIWLSAAAILAGSSTLFAPTDGNPLGNFPVSIWIFVSGTVVSLACVILFNQLTFYTDRKSPAIPNLKPKNITRSRKDARDTKLFVNTPKCCVKFANLIKILAESTRL